MEKMPKQKIKHKVVKLSTKNKDNTQYAVYCSKSDKWKILLVSGWAESEIGEHFHCDCGELVQK
jgi:hypothetical protein